MKNMYTTGILKGGCAVLLCEGFNEAIMEELQPADGPSRIGNGEQYTSFSHQFAHWCFKGGKRPHGGQKSGEGSQGATKKRKFHGKGSKAQLSLSQLADLI